MTEPQPAPRTTAYPDAFESQRRRLLSIAYRMLGSRAEAEDVLQDAWLKWHTSDTSAVRQPAAWLTTVVTRLSIDRLRVLQTERAAQQSSWLPDPWLEPFAPSVEQRVLDGAQLSYGLMLLLERLTPDERAAFLLREAFDCDYTEIGAALDKSTTHCRQLVHRAKARLTRAGAPLEPADLARQRGIVDRLRAAIDARDQTALLEVLAGARVISETAVPIPAAAQVETVALGVDAGHDTGAETALALMVDGDITALMVPWVDARGLVTLHIVTQAAALAAANRLMGRTAISRLLARIARRTRSTVTPAHSEIAT